MVPRQQDAAEWELLVGELSNRHLFQAIYSLHLQVANHAEIDAYNAEL
jgi:hypothetical protein